VYDEGELLGEIEIVEDFMNDFWFQVLHTAAVHAKPQLIYDREISYKAR
jgi:hypothetical protein